VGLLPRGSVVLVLSLLSCTGAFLLLPVSNDRDIIIAQEARSSSPAPAASAWGAKEGELCVGCHAALNPALTQEWRISTHGQKGVNCFGCHRAEPSDVDAFNHNGAVIAVLVSPKDCGRCHQQQVDEQKGSHHAKAGQILASIDNFLGGGGGRTVGGGGGVFSVSWLDHQGAAGR
jgi:hypothetical protein